MKTSFEMFNREIYHCPYCNLCRVGKGLGVDYFHCMNCNACMSRSLMAHTCREKHLEDNCPICHEYIFTSCSPVKALPCGHVMHSTCFQVLPCIFFPSKTSNKYRNNLSSICDGTFRNIQALIISAPYVASHLETCRLVIIQYYHV